MLLRPATGVGVRVPGCPPGTNPQPTTSPFDLIANADNPPAAIERTAVRFGTSAGLARNVRDPSPSCPNRFSPQDQTRLAPVCGSSVSTRLKEYPAATATALLRPAIWTGWRSEPLPYVSRSPHRHTLPSERTASPRLRPAAMSTTFVRPVTRLDHSRLVVVPSPSAPVLLSPQDHTVPLGLSARVCSSAATIFRALPPGTKTGECRSSLVPSPNVPPWFWPPARMSDVPEGVGSVPGSGYPWSSRIGGCRSSRYLSGSRPPQTSRPRHFAHRSPGPPPPPNRVGSAHRISPQIRSCNPCSARSCSSSSCGV